MAVTATAIVRLKRQYPHLDAVPEWATQATLRLLWDRIYDLEERLTAAQATITSVVSGVNAVEATAKEALVQATLKQV
jgi:hypothetical protein